MPRLLAKLPESSRHRGAASRAGTAVSVVVHATLITLAVVATGMGTAAPSAPKPMAHEVIWISRPVERQRTSDAGPSARGDGTTTSRPMPPLPPTGPVLSGPIQVDVGSGPVLGPVVDDPFARTAVGSGTGGGTTGRVDGAGVGSDAPFDANVVEVAARLRAGSPAPRYPEELRGAQLEGRVVVRFVVDTVGRVEPSSVRIVSSTHPLFTRAVQATLPALRFSPARARGRQVRQLVELPFEFAMER